MAANGQIILSINLVEVLALGSTRPSNADVPCNLQNLILKFREGTGANQINKIAYDKRTLPISTPYSYDFTSLPTLSGGTPGFAHVRGIILFNDGDKPVTVGNGLTPLAPFFGAATHTAIVEPGGGEAAPGWWIASRPIGTAGWTVDASNKLLKVDPGAFAVPIRLIAIGD